MSNIIFFPLINHEGQTIFNLFKGYQWPNREKNISKSSKSTIDTIFRVHSQKITKQIS